MAQKNLNVALPADLLMRFKIEAQKRGIKLYAAMAEAIKLWLKVGA